MAKSVTYNKRENEKKKQARRAEKQKKKEDRKLLGKANSFDDMIAYVDENGVITSTPPELNPNKEEIKQEDILISTPKKENIEILFIMIQSKFPDHFFLIVFQEMGGHTVFHRFIV